MVGEPVSDLARYPGDVAECDQRLQQAHERRPGQPGFGREYGERRGMSTVEQLEHEKGPPHRLDHVEGLVLRPGRRSSICHGHAGR